MIGYLRGRISHLPADCCLIDVQGVGYRVFISDATRRKLTIGQEAQLYTYLNVREDAMLLYGFYAQEEYDIFLQLISVSGIGPKVALGMMSAITVDSLCRAIHLKQSAALVKLPGIGKKTAERLILELHDKLHVDTDAAEPTKDQAPPLLETSNAATDAEQALMSLGYTQAEIAPILKKAPKKIHKTEELIKFALKEFAGR